MVLSVLNLSNLNGSNGFAINGIAVYDNSGYSVSGAGDVNGDGLADLVIGAPNADPNGSNSGQSYIVFGRRDRFASLNLSNLDGSNGLAINGIAAGDSLGRSVSGVGDINGDGIDDLVIGANGADPNGDGSGQSYVVFGRTGGFGASLSGFAINGIAAGDSLGRSVRGAGDVNGDGLADLVIGANGADPNGYSSGQSYVVFGRRDRFASLNLSNLNGSNGFAINGVAARDNSGRSVSGAGDVNGDGLADLVIGSYRSDANDLDAGQSYVVFGRRGGFGASLNLSNLNGNNGFKINGVAAGDFSGRSVSEAGDINGDGLADLVIGANGADPNGNYSGQSYVVFGRRGGFGASLNLSNLNGNNGFKINGVAARDFSGLSVSGVKDVNGDGLDDLVIGALGANPRGSDSGQSYVVFGSISGLILRRPLVDASGVTRGGITANLVSGVLQVPNLAFNASFKKNIFIPGYLNVTGTGFADRLTGNGSNNRLAGQAGNDTLIGGGGNDTLIGGVGSDVYYLENFGDIISETSTVITEIDTVRANISYRLSTYLERLSLQGTGNINATGNNKNNLLVGNSGSNLLIGLGGNDTLLGNAGGDVLAGGAGTDVLTGGSGNDSFNYVTGAAFVSSAIGVDLLTDFARTAGNTDKIRLSATSFNAGTTFASVSSDALAASSLARITFSTATGHLFYNQNGAVGGFGTGGHFATLSDINGAAISAANTLLATDFSIIA